MGIVASRGVIRCGVGSSETLMPTATPEPSAATAMAMLSPTETVSRSTMLYRAVLATALPLSPHWYSYSLSQRLSLSPVCVCVCVCGPVRGGSPPCVVLNNRSGPGPSRRATGAASSPTFCSTC